MTKIRRNSQNSHKFTEIVQNLQKSEKMRRNSENLQEIGEIAKGFSKNRRNAQDFAEFAKKTENCAEI